MKKLFTLVAAACAALSVSAKEDIDISSIDRKWKITTSGTYTITLYQLEETVSIVKQ